MAELWGQAPVGIHAIGGAGVIPVGGEVNHNLATGAATFEIVRTGGSYLVIECEVGEHRIRAGKQEARTFDSGDVNIADDEITITAHGYETGDGPLQLTADDATPAYVDTGAETLTFADADPDTIVRSAGDWTTDSFAAGQQITVSGTVSNDGTYVIATAVALTLTLVAGDALTAEALAGAGVTVTGVTLPRGLSEGVDYWIVAVDDDTIQLTLSASAANRIAQTGADNATESDAIVVDLSSVGTAGTETLGGFAPAEVVAASVADGTGSKLFVAGETLVYSGKALTLRSYTAGDIVSWWQV